MSSKNLFSIQSRNERILARREAKHAGRLANWSAWRTLEKIHAEIAPVLQRNRDAHDRLMGVNWEHSNAYGQGRRYGQLTYCGGVHTPANVNSNGMESNEPMWTNGIALKARQES